MNKALKTLKSSMIAQGVISIVLGIIFIAWPGLTAATMAYMLAAWLCIAGLAAGITYFTAKDKEQRSMGSIISGVLCVLLAIVVFFNPLRTAEFIIIFFGIAFMMSGVAGAVRAISMRKYAMSAAEWIIGLVLGILVVIGGLCVIFNPFGSAISLVWLMGIMGIFNGVSVLIIEFFLSRTIKKATMR